MPTPPNASRHARSLGAVRSGRADELARLDDVVAGLSAVVARAGVVAACVLVAACSATGSTSDDASVADDDAGDLDAAATPHDVPYSQDLWEPEWRPDTAPVIGPQRERPREFEPGLTRALAEEAWVLPLVSHDGLNAHGSAVFQGEELAAGDDRVYVLSRGPRDANDLVAVVFLHAVDADGNELWRVEAPYLVGAQLAVDTNGDVIAVGRGLQLSHHPAPSGITRISRDGEVLWNMWVNFTPGRPALDDEGNIYLVDAGPAAVHAAEGQPAMMSVGAQGEVRWRRPFPATVDAACRSAYAYVVPVVVGDHVWFSSACGLWVLTRDDVVVVEPLATSEPSRPAGWLRVVAGLSSGDVLAMVAGALIRSNTAGTVKATWPGFSGTPVIGAGDVLVESNGGGGVYTLDGVGERLWQAYVGAETGHPVLLDAEGRLAIYHRGRYLDLFDVESGARQATYDLGRDGIAGSEGVVLREGELIVAVDFEAIDGRTVFGLQSVRVPLGPPPEGVWSRVDGDPRRSRFVRPVALAPE